MIVASLAEARIQKQPLKCRANEIDESRPSDPLGDCCLQGGCLPWCSATPGYYRLFSTVMQAASSYMILGLDYDQASWLASLRDRRMTKGWRSVKADLPWCKLHGRILKELLHRHYLEALPVPDFCNDSLMAWWLTRMKILWALSCSSVCFRDQPLGWSRVHRCTEHEYAVLQALAATLLGLAHIYWA